tara:strand:- start:31 stop:234 length:204 start_codon:yes stop_codon:yes gene_type:complete
MEIQADEERLVGLSTIPIHEPNGIVRKKAWTTEVRWRRVNGRDLRAVVINLVGNRHSDVVSPLEKIA